MVVPNTTGAAPSGAILSSQHHIHHHHQHEADGETDGGEVGVGAFGGFGDEFFDQTLAATITPLANPNSVFCSRSGISFFMKKTNADPSMVPNSGSSIPIMIAGILL